MRTDDFDRHIMEGGSLRIPPAELPRFTPWRPAMDRIVVERPCSLSGSSSSICNISSRCWALSWCIWATAPSRLENRWFRLGWLLSALLLQVPLRPSTCSPPRL